MADQQKASDVEEIGGLDLSRQTNTPPTLSISSESESAVGASILVDPSPYIDQVEEFKQLADERGIRIEDLEKQVDALRRNVNDKENQIARLNAQLGTERETDVTLINRRGNKKEELKSTIGRLEAENNDVKSSLRAVTSERDNSKARLHAWRYGTIGLAFLSIALLSVVFVKLPCQACPSCPPVVNIGQYIEKIDTLKGEVKAIQTVKDQLQSRNGNLQTQNVNLQTENVNLQSRNENLKSENVNLQTKSVNLQSKNEELDRNVAKLKKQSKENSVRLSECLTINNIGDVSESDLEPGNLAKEYSQIYDQDYTMALDELEQQKGETDIKETVRFFLDILQTSHRLSEDYTQRHIVSMNQSVTSVLIEFPDQSTQDKRKTEWVNSTLSKKDLKDFYGLRQNSAWRMRESIADELGEMVAKRFDIDSDSQPLMMTYVKKCVSLCWKMNMHRDPVYIDFYEPAGVEEFNYDVFKPFLHQTGTLMDYMVWPPMFERRGGQMIGKGIAERKD